MKHLTIILAFLITLSTQANSETFFSFKNTLYSFDEQNTFCKPNALFSQRFSSIEKAAKEAGVASNVVHMTQCGNAEATKGGKVVIPTLWIAPTEPKQWSKDLSDLGLQKTVDSLLKNQFPVMFNEPKIKDKLNNFLNTLNDDTSMTVAPSNEVFIVQIEPILIFLNISTFDFGNDKGLTPVYFTSRAVNNEIFNIYVNYPMGYGFNKDYLKLLNNIAVSLKVFD